MRQSSKSALRNFSRRMCDAFSRHRFACRRGRLTGVALPYFISIAQPMPPSEALEAKRHNLRQAARRINDVVVLPGEVFSFWRIVGSPHDARRFKAGRTIRGGEVCLDLGGGLCQASGIIHHLAIRAGLEVVERHCHSVDLYTDATRFAPLGTDATVFYGYKDLRLRNNLGAPLRFVMDVQTDRVVLMLQCGAPIVERALDIVTTTDKHGVKLSIVVDPEGREVCRSVYRPQ